MSISAEFPAQRSTEPSSGTAGLRTRIGGSATTVSALMGADKGSLVKKAIG